MLPIREMLVDPNKYAVKCPYSMTASRIVVHNTANDASANNEISYMRNNSNEVSFHAAVDDKEIVIGVPFNRNTWNAGDGGGKGNREGIAIEICYSKSGGERFEKAEKNAAEYIAHLLKERGWGVDKVTKHQDYCGKYCPHRTLEMGWERFLNMVRSFMGEAVKPTETSRKPTLKSLEEITQEVLAGKWGNNPERKEKLLAAGYDYDAIQNKINNNAAPVTPKPSLKSVAEIALEVNAGLWGNGTERKEKLAKAGYNVDAVQDEVNRICGVKAASVPTKKSVTEIAQEIIDKDNWGTGEDRKGRLRAAGYDPDAVQKEINRLM